MRELAHQPGAHGSLRELALFAGAGGGILGGHILGWRTVCAVEWDAYAASVLCARQNDGVLPPFPIWDDVRTFDGTAWRGCVDVVSGGFPCQAWSTAARGRNTASSLWPEMLRIVGEVCPSFVFAENVDEGAIVEAQADLEVCGYSTRRVMVAASDLGADHPRERWWMVGNANDKGQLVGRINAEVARVPPVCCGVWSPDAGDPRIPSRVAARMDRFKCIGNGQVPAVAAMAWQILTARTGEDKEAGE